MKPSRRTASIAGLTFVAVVFAGDPVRAGTMTGGATEWTQILNNISLLQQVIHLIRSVVQLKKQVEYWAQNLKGLGSLDELDHMLSGMRGVVSSTRGIIFAGETIAREWQDRGPLTKRWEQTRPGVRDPRALPAAQGQRGDDVDANAFRRIDDSLQLAVKKSLSTLDVQVSELDDDEEVFSKLKDRLGALSEDDKAGQLRAILIGNELLLEMLKQLMKLRQVLIAQANATGEYQSAEAQRRQFGDAINDRHYKYTGAYRGDSDEPAWKSPLPSVSIRSAGPATDNAGAPPRAPAGSSYTTPSGRTVGRAPGVAETPSGGSYATPDGRSVGRAPGAAAAPSNGSYTTSGGRVVGRAPGAEPAR